MSSRRKKKPEARPAEAPPAPAPKRPSGRVPEAMVSSRNGTAMVHRLGRGYSFGEISGAGLSPGLATRWGVRIDLRRRSVLEGNVDSLKRWGLGALVPARKTEGRIKKVEEELVKAGREVEKEAAEVKGEVVKVEKAAKKEAARAEKAVKAKVEKPRAKSKKKQPS